MYININIKNVYIFYVEPLWWCLILGGGIKSFILKGPTDTLAARSLDGHAH